MHIMSRKEGTGGVGQVGIAGDFNTRFTFRKEEKVQIAAEAGTEEESSNKKPLGDSSRAAFYIKCFL